MTTIYLVRYADMLDKDDDAKALWWSNEAGWAPLSEAVVFTAAEQKEFTPPLGGEWVPFISTTTLDEHVQQALDTIDERVDYPFEV